MKKQILLAILLAVIIIVLLGVLFFLPAKKSPQPSVNGIEITSPKANEEISSPLKIVGVVNGNGWSGFEGQVGLVELRGSNGQSLATGVLTATTEWTTLPTNFETNLNFQSPIAQAGTLVFKNENASGSLEKDKTFVLPVKIEKGQTANVNVYFSNSKLDPQVSCNKVFASQRVVQIYPTGYASADAFVGARPAVEELLKGPTAQETAQGYYTSINQGVKIKSFVVENGVAKVDFDEQLEKGIAGSCKVSAIRAQITQTLEQFLAIKNVIISINGNSETILQP